jgi:hypothetical protein
MISKMISKIEAEYIEHAKKRHCEDCGMYREPHKCTLVEGVINEDGHCKYFKRASSVKRAVENG